MARVIVLGATGYVGGRLVPRLLQDGHQVVAASRSARKLSSRPWASHPEVATLSVDVLDRDSLVTALRGCEVCFYLVHSMERKVDFESTDRRAAQNLAWAAGQAGVQRIIYLGGLGDESTRLSRHLKSRAEVGQILRTGPVPVTILRAAMIIGSGSASFEILRYLVDRLPVMVTPRWVETRSQPIAIRNVLDYLVGCLRNSATTGGCFDIGGPDVLTYRELMKLYAREAGLPRRWVIPVPVFTPKLSSYWIHLVTPVHAELARPLAEGLRYPTVCGESAIEQILPVQKLSCKEAIRLALRNQLSHHLESHWTDAGPLPPEETVHPGDASWSGGTVYSDRRRMRVLGSLDEVWQTIVRIGGETGWYYGDTLWRIRGLMDTLMGGVGSRRGRRDPNEVLPGDALDFWRVLQVQPRHRLRLLAEMKVPGQAILEFELSQPAPGVVEVVQSAWFAPSGLLGILYWLLVSPLHNLVFDGMLQGIARAARTELLTPPVCLDQGSGS
ncbi:SDR family oxidoreductase [bacterium]|nr:SDR family oxidoreductase [bacterium]